SWLGDLDVDFGLRAGAVDAGALSFDDVAASGTLRGRQLMLPDIAGRWLGGKLTASLDATLGAAPELAGKLALAQGEMGQAGALLLADPDAEGRFDLDASFSAASSDVARLGAALAGTGRFRAGAGTVAGFDLAALAPLLGETASEGSLLPQVTAALTSGQTRFDAAEGEIEFAAGGVSRLSGEVRLDAAKTLAIAADLVHDRIEIAPVGAGR